LLRGGGGRTASGIHLPLVWLKRPLAQGGGGGGLKAGRFFITDSF